MEDIFSKLKESDAAIVPSPIILPNVECDFQKQRNADGSVAAILFVFWMRSLPLVQFVIPFDRLFFASFIQQAQRMIAGEDNGDIDG